MKAKRLSNTQERALLQRILKRGTLIGSGSSRLVFLDPQNPQWIVKIAVGNCSLRQNKNEVALWQQYGDEGYLARIKEYGNFCVVMERLPYIIEYGDYSSYAAKQKIRHAYRWLESTVGYTVDNQQLGRTHDGRWVAYDYGFDPAESSWYQCGWAENLRNSDDVTAYLRYIRTLLLQKKAPTQCEQFSNGTLY